MKRNLYCQLKEGGQKRLIKYDCDYDILGIKKTRTKVSVKILLVEPGVGGTHL